MKKWILALIILTIICTTGCSNAPQQITANTDAQETLVKAGQEFLVILTANPSTGYDWVPRYDEKMLKFINRTYEPFAVPEGQVGSGGMEYLKFKALKQGKTNIALDYMRAGDTQPSQQYVYAVNIN
jgi:inhibitor of cysteine peptidase